MPDRDRDAMARALEDIEGVEIPEGDAPTPDQAVKLARDQLPFLKRVTDGALAKYIRSRWDRHEKIARRWQAELKVNHLRYRGNAFVQIHPNRKDEVWVPSTNGGRTPPTLNKIRRAVHRYQAQVTADEPIIEGVPASHEDESRDAAEAATHALRGEWDRMKLQKELEMTAQQAAVHRSAFWFFEWDPHKGGKTAAQKFFKDEAGERYLAYVDKNGEQVEDKSDAAMIWKGEMTMTLLSPLNVRWNRGRYAHDSDEVLVGLLVPLRRVLAMSKKARKAKVVDLLADSPPDAEQWLDDLRSASPRQFDVDSIDSEIRESTADELEESDEILDEKVFVLHYFREKSKEYPEGQHVITAGKVPIQRGKLKYGVPPLAHFKLIDDLGDPLGLALVDILRDPQQLLDFVNTQVMRFLQTLRRRWFVPMHSGVKARDLLNPHNSIIEFNPQAGGEPKAETQGEIPSQLSEWVDRFDREFNDESGMHETLQGKHVPGVSSGRHAEALRSGDETLLGLTRTQLREGLEAAGRIMLEIIKAEWSTERRVRYFGEDREYIDLAFKNTDFGDTSQVRLKNGTLLMLTPAQKLETLFGYAEMGALDPKELRRLAPIADTAGINLSEDPHYKRARRQNTRFLAGPPEELQSARDEYDEQIERLQSQLDDLNEILAIAPAPQTQEAVQQAVQKIQQDAQELEQEWMAELDVFAFDHREWEADPNVASIHAEEHLRALASDKAHRFPEWWVELFEQHAITEWMAAQPPAPAGQGQGGGAPPDAAPAGMGSMEGAPPAVTGQAP